MPKPQASSFSSRAQRVALFFRKDLLRRRREPLAVLLLLAFPLVFAGMLALAFGGDDNATPRAHLLIEDLDGGLVGGLVRAAFGSDQLADVLEVEVVGAEGFERLEAGEASALLRIPRNTTDHLFNGGKVTFELVRNPAQGLLPEIAEQISSVLTDLLDVAAHLVAGQAADLGLGNFESFEDVDDTTFAAVAVRARQLGQTAIESFDSPPLPFEVVERNAEGELAPAGVLRFGPGDGPAKNEAAGEEAAGEEAADDTQEKDSGSGSTNLAQIFLFVLPGVSVYSLFMIGDQTMRDLLVEAEAGTLRRQLVAPTVATELVMAKVLVSLVVGLVGLAILAAIAGWMVSEPVDLIGLSLLAFGIVLAATGFAALNYGATADERQGSALAGVVYLALAFLGGAFVPTDSMPDGLRAAAPISPFYWGTTGFRELLSGAHWSAVGQHAVILGGLGFVLLATGAALLQRRLRRGMLK